MAMLKRAATGGLWLGVWRWASANAPWSAQTVLLGGHVRVGLEDNLYLDKGVLATNADLVRRARSIIEVLGMRVLSTSEARARIGLG